MEKYRKNGKIAILVSPGFGAGWSTWNQKELAYDKRVVEFWLDHKDDSKFMEELDNFNNATIKSSKELFASWGYEHVYFGGFKEIVLIWLNEGTDFIITEYDGSENLMTINNIKWEKA